MSVQTLANALLEGGILEAATVDRWGSRNSDAHRFLDQILEEGLASEPAIAGIIARALGVPRFDPRERSPEPQAMALLDSLARERLMALPVALRGGGELLWVAVCDPSDDTQLREIAQRTGKRVRPCVIGPRELARALRQAARADVGAETRPVAQEAPRAAGGGLEEELTQMRQVVRVLTQMLIERGLVDGVELKRRLRAERDRQG